MSDTNNETTAPGLPTSPLKEKSIQQTVFEAELFKKGSEGVPKGFPLINPPNTPKKKDEQLIDNNNSKENQAINKSIMAHLKIFEFTGSIIDKTTRQNNILAIPLTESCKQYLKIPLNEKSEIPNEIMFEGKKYSNPKKIVSIIEVERIRADKLLPEFLKGIQASISTPPTPTGFKELDRAFDGGLYPGLYIIGAISSLGKTTFILQIADQIAASGSDVIIFSMEQSTAELIAKSLSRLSYISCKNETEAKTTRGILDGAKHDLYNEREKELYHTCMRQYAEIAKNIYIVEGTGDIGISHIRETIERHIKTTGKRPVIIIDYLQIIPASDMRATDKQNTDKAVFELKGMSRDNKLPVIAISSLNRASYKDKISMAAFKESGAIEYSSDVLIGLQFQNNGQQIDNEMIDKEKGRATRKIELKILKQRNGRTGQQIHYDYIPMFNHFRETGESEGIPEGATRGRKAPKGKDSQAYSVDPDTTEVTRERENVAFDIE